MSDHVEAILAKRPKWPDYAPNEGRWSALLSAYADELEALVRRLAAALEEEALLLTLVSDECAEREAVPGHSDHCLPCLFYGLKLVAAAALASPETPEEAR